MKLCVFQGTFNPIHRGHLQMAEFIDKNYDFDKILFIPAHKPPHKEYSDSMSEHRLNMVKLATAHNPHFDVSDIEYRNEEKSYTYITICKLYEQYEIEGKIKFIIGTDAFKRIENWYMSDKLKEMVDFIVFIRENEFEENKFDDLKNNGYSFEFAKMDFVDISSTKLKDRIQKNEPIDDLVTEEVEYYIRQNGLYKYQ